jgi:peroxiredoxin (alkyl hydroperoxide reductase subunit C)
MLTKINKTKKERKMEETKFDMPLLGDDFPEMSVQTTHGKMNIPGDFKGKWFVLFSHPADFTPVCTTEFVAFQKRYEEFEKMDCQLVGMSVDQVFSHIKWVEWIKENLDVEIKFPVIAANDTIANRLGMLHPGKGTNTVRAVFIVDPKGKVRLIMYYPQEIGRNMDEIVRAVKALQISEKQGAVPAGWPNNELIKDRIIVSPPSDEKTAKERLQDKSLECFDWWFCHKPYEK